MEFLDARRGQGPKASVLDARRKKNHAGTHVVRVRPQLGELLVEGARRRRGRHRGLVVLGINRCLLGLGRRRRLRGGLEGVSQGLGLRQVVAEF